MLNLMDFGRKSIPTPERLSSTPAALSCVAAVEGWQGCWCRDCWWFAVGAAQGRFLVGGGGMWVTWWVADG